MGGIEAGRGLPEKVEALLNEDFEPATVARGLRDFLVRVADTFEAEFPFFSCAIGQALGFARDAIDLAAGGANLVEDAAADIAP